MNFLYSALLQRQLQFERGIVPISRSRARPTTAAHQLTERIPWREHSSRVAMQGSCGLSQLNHLETITNVAG